MSIEGLTDQEKSAMLAKAMGLKYSNIRDDSIYRGYGFAKWCDANGDQFWGEKYHDNLYGKTQIPRLDLYDPGNMALAWRVLNWAHRVGFCAPTWLKLNDWFKIESYDNKNHLHLWGQAPADAQRAWLDKVLELAIEAGIIAPD